MLGVEAQPFGRRRDAPALVSGQARGGIIAKRGKALHRGVLLHVADPGAGGGDAQTAVGLHKARHHLHQRRLA